MSRPPRRIEPLSDAAEAGERFEQLRLSVALDAGDAENLAGVDREAHAVHRGEPPNVVDGEVANLEQRASSGPARPLRSRRAPRSSAR